MASWTRQPYLEHHSGARCRTCGSGCREQSSCPWRRSLQLGVTLCRRYLKTTSMLAAWPSSCGRPRLCIGPSARRCYPSTMASALEAWGTAGCVSCTTGMNPTRHAVARTHGARAVSVRTAPGPTMTMRIHMLGRGILCQPTTLLCAAPWWTCRPPPRVSSRWRGITHRVWHIRTCTLLPSRRWGGFLVTSLLQCP